MPNGGYDPVPIRQHDAAVRRALISGAAATVLGAIEAAAKVTQLPFSEMVRAIESEREQQRISEAMATPKPPPDPADVPVTIDEEDEVQKMIEDEERAVETDNPNDWPDP